MNILLVVQASFSMGKVLFIVPFSLGCGNFKVTKVRTYKFGDMV